MSPRKNHSLLHRLLAVCLAVACVLTVSACQRGNTTDGVRILFFDVGQGNAALIRTPEGDILIDAGGEGTEVFLCTRLRQLGVGELALAVFTSSASESIGGADGVLEEFGARSVWYNGGFVENESAEQLGIALDALGIEAQYVDAYRSVSIGGVSLGVLLPFAMELDVEHLVLQLSYGGFSAVWMGRASADEEAQLCASYSRAVLESDLLVVGRHGSQTVTGEALLETLSPQYALISCGENNLYGYPTGELLERLAATGTQVLRTDRDGEIVFVADGGGLCLSEGQEKRK